MHYKDKEVLKYIDGYCLRESIKYLSTCSEIKWSDTSRDGSLACQIPYPIYPNEILRIFDILETSFDYLDNYEKYCKGVIPTSMNARQIKVMLTYISRGERFCDGHIEMFIKNGVLLKLLLRLDDLLDEMCTEDKLDRVEFERPLYRENGEPIFYFGKDDNGKIYLERPNHRRIFEEREDDGQEVSEFAEEGYTRSRLYMALTNEWDVTAFGCTMSSCFSSDTYSDVEGKYQYLFISSQTAEKRLFPKISDSDKTVIIANVERFYKDIEAQLRSKDMILFPVCLKKYVDREEYLPVYLGDINSDVPLEFEKLSDYWYL